MCFGAPGRIIQIGGEHPHLASVEMQGLVRQINVGLIEDRHPQPGDWVDVHLGMALAVIDEEEAAEALAFLESLHREGLA